MIKRLAQLDRSFTWPAIVAGSLHLALLVAISVSWASEPEASNARPVPRHINAVIVPDPIIQQRIREQQEAAARQAKQREQEAQREAQRRAEREKQRQAEAERQRKAAEAKKQAEAARKKAEDAAKKLALKKKKEAEQRQREEQRKKEEQRKLDAQRKAEAEAKRQQEQKQAAEQKRREEELQLAKLAAEAEASLQQQLAEQAEAQRRIEISEREYYQGLFRDQVSKRWRQLRSAEADDLIVVVRIRLASNGEVVDADIERSSGNTAFDQSALNAIYRVGKFPVPSNTALFEKYFRNFLFRFDPGVDA